MCVYYIYIYIYIYIYVHTHTHTHTYIISKRGTHWISCKNLQKCFLVYVILRKCEKDVQIDKVRLHMIYHCLIQGKLNFLDEIFL